MNKPFPSPPRLDAAHRHRSRLSRELASALVCFVVAGALADVPTAHAAGVTTANVNAELVSEQETIRPGETFTVGIALRPAAGWHTYWINPGDSGLPTKVDWKLPSGFHAGELEWPHPVRLGMPPYVTYGYEGDSLLLTAVDGPASLQPGASVDLVAAVRWLACREDACVPGKAELALRLRIEASPPLRDLRWSDAFDAARARLPKSIDGWTAKFSENGSALRIEISAPAQQRPSTTGVQVFPLAAGVINESAETLVHSTESGFVIDAARDDRAARLPDSLGLVLVADGGWDAGGKVRALRLDARAAAATGATVADPGAAIPAPAPTARRAAAAVPSPARAPSLPHRDSSTDLTLWAAISLAFLGGLILNLMPCVFPVLSLKVLGFIHVAHHEAATVRRHGYAFTAGVLVSFWILAGALLALRAAGGLLGWGFQLQEPLFVAAIAGLLLAMALNLLGVFEFGSTVAGSIGRLDSQHGYRGSFLSGVLATVLATPCSAPFMGTAIGFALVQSTAVSLAVFTALGAGMASPYLLLACAPVLLRRLPRPGAWMESFREAMAFPLLATVAWLVWVFGQQTGNDGVLKLLLALLAGSVGAWTGGRFSGHIVARATTLLCVTAAIFLAVDAAGSRASQVASPAARNDGTAVAWIPWDPDSIVRHRSDGHVVFVDFTADWCLSCKVNERVALAGDEFAAMMREHEAIAMKADWTRADPRITAALDSFGRSGVPLYVVYPRNPAGEPIVLPQILTPNIVREALAKANA